MERNIVERAIEAESDTKRAEFPSFGRILQSCILVYDMLRDDLLHA